METFLTWDMAARFLERLFLYVLDDLADSISDKFPPFLPFLPLDRF